MNSRIKNLLQSLQSVDLAPIRWLDSLAMGGQVHESKTTCDNIFIIAAPRSGSTLLYQLLTHSFDVNYHTNLEYFLYHYPILGYKIRASILTYYASDFTSSFGFVEGLNGPAEANKFWEYWFGLDLHGSSVDVSSRTQRGIAYFQYLAQKTAKPFLSGWIGHISYFDWICREFPDAKFVVLRRSVEEIALSLLNAHRKNGKTDQDWFSIRPKHVHRDSHDLHWCVAAQAHYLNGLVNYAAQQVSERALGIVVTYDELCENPRGIIDKFECFYEQCGSKIYHTANTIPELFRKSDSSLKYRDDILAIRKALGNITK